MLGCQESFGSEVVYKKKGKMHPTSTLCPGHSHSHNCDNTVKIGWFTGPKTTLLPSLFASLVSTDVTENLIRFLEIGRFVGWVAEIWVSTHLMDFLFSVKKKVAKIEGKRCPNWRLRNGGVIAEQEWDPGCQ